jgi:hypothetical protein
LIAVDPHISSQPFTDLDFAATLLYVSEIAQAKCMSITIILQALSVAGSAVKSITGWLKKSQGDFRSIMGELKDNLK